MSLDSSNELDDTISLDDSEDGVDSGLADIHLFPPLARRKYLRLVKLFEDFKTHLSETEGVYHATKIHNYLVRRIIKGQSKSWSKDYTPSVISDMPSSISFRGGRSDTTLSGSMYSHRMGYPPPPHMAMGGYPPHMFYNRAFYPYPPMDYSVAYPPMPPPPPPQVPHNQSYSAQSVRSASFYDSGKYPHAPPPRRPMDTWSVNSGPFFNAYFHEPSYDPAPSVVSNIPPVADEEERSSNARNLSRLNRSKARQMPVIEETEELNLSTSFPNRLFKSRSVQSVNQEDRPLRDTSPVFTRLSPSPPMPAKRPSNGRKDRSLEEQRESRFVDKQVPSTSFQPVASTSRADESIAQPAETTYTLINWSLVKGPGVIDVKISGSLLDKDGNIDTNNHVTDYVAARMKGSNNVRMKNGTTYTLCGPLKDPEKAIPQEVKNYFKDGKFPILWRKAIAIWNSYIVNTSDPQKQKTSSSRENNSKVASTKKPQEEQDVNVSSAGSSRYGRAIQPTRHYWQNDKDSSSMISTSLDAKDKSTNKGNNDSRPKRKLDDSVSPPAQKKRKSDDGKFLKPAPPKPAPKKGAVGRPKKAPKDTSIASTSSGRTSRNKKSPSKSDDKENKSVKGKGRQPRNLFPVPGKNSQEETQQISKRKDSDDIFSMQSGRFLDFQLGTKSYSPNSILNSVKKHYKKAEESMTQTPPGQILKNFMQSRASSVSSHSSIMELDTSINAPRNPQLLKRVVREEKKGGKKKSPVRTIVDDGPPEVAEALAALKSNARSTPTVLKNIFRNNNSELCESTSDFSDG